MVINMQILNKLDFILDDYKLLRYIYIVLGCFISAVGINLFLTPNNLLADGATGLAMIFYYTLHVPLSIALILINIPIFYYFNKYLSNDFLQMSIFGLILYTFILEFTSDILIPFSPTDDLILAAIFGGVLNGVGCGFVFKASASTGGTDIIGYYIKKKYGLDIGTTCFIINAVIIFITFFILGATIALYTLISMYITGKLTNDVIDGINTKKSAFIITKKYSEVSKRIINEVERSTTIIDAVGGYSGESTKIIMSIVTATQIVRIKQILAEVDKNSVLFIWEVSDVKSKSFSFQEKEKKINQLNKYLKPFRIKNKK